MKKIRWSSAFKADYKLAKRSGRYRDSLDGLEVITTVLANGEPMPSMFRDHALVGKWSGCRDCHLAPDLLLIYRHESDSAVAFLRLGSHSELFG